MLRLFTHFQFYRHFFVLDSLMTAHMVQLGFSKNTKTLYTMSSGLQVLILSLENLLVDF